MEDKNYSQFSRKRLSANIEKKFQTTIIGALAAFEEFFGKLWGHGKPISELTDEEVAWRQIWQQARTRVLDLGHSNARAAKSELSHYDVHWNRYVTNFRVVNRRED